MARAVLGAQLYTVRAFTRNIADIAATLKKVARIGYTAVQISAFGPADPKDVASAVADAGVIVAATHVGWDRFRKDIDAVIAEHKLWGCNHPAVGGLPPEYATADGLKRFLEEVVPVAEALAAEGMDFSYHNHNHEFARIGEKTWLETLYDESDPSILKAELDVYWVQAGGGDPAAWVDRCAGREPLLHLKDMAISADGKQQMAEIGEGNLNWPAILAAAADGGVEYCLVEQDDTYGRDPFECLATSYRNLKAMGLK
jgi:sugar phosphate isomerase/epimerase